MLISMFQRRAATENLRGFCLLWQAAQLGGTRAMTNVISIRHTLAVPVARWALWRVKLGVECAAWFAVMMLTTLPGLAVAQSSCPGIHVKILNIKNSTGTVACALFESAEGFPTDYLREATNVMVIKIRKDQARCDFEDIPPGTYAMAVVHDENMNGKLDTGFLGVPTEGYGFSNDARGVLGAPSFSAASFPYDGQNLELTMSLQY